jgi:phosphate ABC transporter phosphate-binding protein
MDRMRRRFAVVALVILGLLCASSSAGAQSYERISGEGSTWAQTAIDAMRVNVKQFGITVDYAGTGSTAGRKNWLRGLVDFAASDIPFQFRPEDGSEPDNPKPGSYAYIPVTAGGTSFMYNLKINGQRVTNLRLSGDVVAKIFAGAIKKWNDPAIAADNPGLTMPDRVIVPVVRSDGSGSTAQFTRWLVQQHNAIWLDYCQRAGRAPACGPTSFWPPITGIVSQSGDFGVAGYVKSNQAEGAIGYVNYSYALNNQFPVAKVLNAAGYYTEPTPQNVAVSLLKARINTDRNSQDYLTQILDDVYTDPDPRNYQLSSYSYFILPTEVRGNFSTDKGRTLGAFTYYAMCQAQQQSASLGYSPIPINLVQASLEQIRRIPGVEVQNIDIKRCNNPTFSPDGTNTLARNAPQPQPCDKKGATQCAAGTGGSKASTPVKAAASGGLAPVAGGRTGASGGRSAGATDAVAAAASGAAVDCDPSLGPCEGSSALELAGGESVDTAVAEGGQVSTVLAGQSGWGSPQTLAALIALLVLALVVVPPLAWRRFEERGP